MPATTPNRSIPYPLAGDAITDFPAVAASAASILDTHTHPYATAGAAGVPFRMAQGTATVVIAAGSFQDNVAVVFPTSRFTVAPFVQVSVQGTGTALTYVIGADTVTATGCNISARHRSDATGGATLTVRWLAVQMLSGAAAG